MQQSRRRDVLILSTEAMLTLMGVVINRIGAESYGGSGFPVRGLLVLALVLALLVGTNCLIVFLWRYQTRPFRVLSFLLLLFCMAEIGSGF